MNLHAHAYPHRAVRSLYVLLLGHVLVLIEGKTIAKHSFSFMYFYYNVCMALANNNVLEAIRWRVGKSFEAEKPELR